MSQNSKKVMVIGASENPLRYSNIATIRLLQNNHEVVPVGIKEGMINGAKILVGKPVVENIDTVTLYINPGIQKEYYDYVLRLNPKRIIFNPGTENSEFEKLASEKGIETVEACTLVMLSTKVF
jgi:predicted CoA-binding protein